MLYFTENLPSRKISYQQLDSIFTHASDVLGIPEDVVFEIQFTYDINFPQYGDVDVEIEDTPLAVIRVNRRANTKEIIATLFHELVHVEQMLSGTLTPDEHSWRLKWNGQLYEREYLDLPWEMEAFSMEQYMMITYMEKYDGLYS